MKSSVGRERRRESQEDHEDSMKAWWSRFIVFCAFYSCCFTPFQFGFFRGLPKHLWALEIVPQVVFFMDFCVRLFLYNPQKIDVRYVIVSFILDIFGFLPWDIIYTVAGRKEELRYMMWLRLYRVRKSIDFFQKMEKDVRINYVFRILKLICVELYCTHTAACIFYYLATTIPESKEGFTWVGSLNLGDYTYAGFREVSLLRLYITSLYFAIVTITTVRYGDVHAVNSREMVFVMIFVYSNMILGAYLTGNMTALIIKESKTQRFMDKMANLMKYLKRHNVDKHIRDEIKGQMTLHYKRGYGDEASVLEDIPVSIRAKVLESLHMTEVVRDISEPKGKICTVFSFHPLAPRDQKRRNGLVMRVPETIDALLQATAQHFGSVGTIVLTEDVGEVLHADLIQHNQKLYIVNVDD